MLRRSVYSLLRLYWKIARPTVLGVRALVIRDGKVLLIRHTYIDGWYLPGGGVEKRESFRNAIIRELKEEVGINASDLKLFGLYHTTKHGKNDHVALFVAENFAKENSQSNDPEIAEAKWFLLSDLPNETTPSSRRRIQEYISKSPPAHDW
jgi:ADP-ribose pyrophosphatase YjhB (NUDIX family)